MNAIRIPCPRARVTLHVSQSDTPKTRSRLDTRSPLTFRQAGGATARLCTESGLLVDRL